MSSRNLSPGPLPPGKQCTVFTGVLTDTTDRAAFNIDSDSIQASLFVKDVTGSVNVRIYTITQAGELEIIAFPEITSDLAEIPLQKAATSMQRIRTEIEVTGTAR